MNDIHKGYNDEILTGNATFVLMKGTFLVMKTMDGNAWRKGAPCLSQKRSFCVDRCIVRLISPRRCPFVTQKRCILVMTTYRSSNEWIHRLFIDNVGPASMNSLSRRMITVESTGLDGKVDTYGWISWVTSVNHDLHDPLDVGLRYVDVGCVPWHVRVRLGTLRGALWRVMLGVWSVRRGEWCSQMDRQEAAYREQCLQYLAPSGHWYCVNGDPLTDPMYEKRVEIARQIHLDVERMFGEEVVPETFRIALTRILLIFGATEGFRYRQGMNEIVAVLIVSLTSAPPTSCGANDASSSGRRIAFASHCDEQQRQMIESGAFECLVCIARQMRNVLEVSSSPASDWSQWLVGHREVLRWADPILYAHLYGHLNLLPEYYVIRWVRTLFAYDFGWPIIARIWDVLLASTDASLETPILHNALIFSVVLVLSSREPLLACTRMGQAVSHLQNLQVPQSGFSNLFSLFSDLWHTTPYIFRSTFVTPERHNKEKVDS